jgi:hypothetical protein
VYIVRIPLATHSVYNVYRVLPFPIKINDMKAKYTFIQPARECILTDSTNQYYIYSLGMKTLANVEGRVRSKLYVNRIFHYRYGIRLATVKC